VTDILRVLYRSQERILALWRVMSLWDAIKLTLAGERPGEARIHLRPIGRTVVIRRNTTDLLCLEQVFLENEYQSPFELTPRVIIDAGANVGMATLFFAHRYPEARIVALEPEPMNFQMLSRNCRDLPNVTLIKAALWSQTSDLTLHNKGTGAWRVYVTDEHSEFDGAAVVSGITIPEILRCIKCDRVDLLKLDIEGSERQLFSKGAGEWLDQVHHIVIELHDRYLQGCAQAFYKALMSRSFVQEIRGDNIFVRFDDVAASVRGLPDIQCMPANQQ